MLHKVDIDLFGVPVSFETGHMAKQANGSVIVRSGDSVVLVTACTAPNRSRWTTVNTLTPPGRIPGGF
jgi:polyribonucleotide nucleotidyltransferase